MPLFIVCSFVHFEKFRELNSNSSELTAGENYIAFSSKALIQRGRIMLTNGVASGRSYLKEYQPKTLTKSGWKW